MKVIWLVWIGGLLILAAASLFVTLPPVLGYFCTGGLMTCAGSLFFVVWEF